MSSSTSIIERSKDSRRSTFFNKIAYNLVIEVLDRSPLNLLANIFFLFGLQGQLYEDLLKLLVDVVDTQLFEGIVL